jgi:N-acetyl-anhydromuramyl-L-alanine amidase AmpD
MASSRHHPNVTVRKNVANQSSRNGARIGLIVLHDTEGGNVPNSSRDLQGLADFFDRPAVQASSHVGVDQDGNSSRMVPDSQKAWTQAFYNPVSL